MVRCDCDTERERERGREKRRRGRGRRIRWLKKRKGERERKRELRAFRKRARKRGDWVSPRGGLHAHTNTHIQSRHGSIHVVNSHTAPKTTYTLFPFTHFPSLLHFL